MTRMSASDPFKEPILRSRARVIVGLFAAHLIWVQLTFSQRAQGIFGPCLETQLSAMPAGLFVESFKGSRPTVALLTSNPSVLTSYAIASDGSLAEQYRATLTSRCRFWATWENDGEGNISLLGVGQME